MFLGRPAHAKSAQMDGQMDRYRRLHTDVKTYTSLQPLERATAQIQIQIFIFLEAKKIRLSFLQAWRDNIFFLKVFIFFVKKNYTNKISNLFKKY